MEDEVKDENESGVIYILTNPSFPNYVKIGYADNLEKRLRDLNRSECIPFAFHPYAVCEMSGRLLDKKVHRIIDRLNPSLRAIDEFDGKPRVKEFFAISPEDAYGLLEDIAEISGAMKKLRRIEPEEHAIRDETLANKIEIESKKRKKPRPQFSYSFFNIPVGAKIQYIPNPNITATVADEKHIQYQGKTIQHLA